MTMPLDLVLVRHGESEGNHAARLAEQGRQEEFDRIYEGRHTRSFRLTNKGITQGDAAGGWIRKEFGSFDRHYVSDYARALETAYRLNLPEANWYVDPYLTERDWGDFDAATAQERSEAFERAFRMRDIEPFYWSPPNGESFNQLCLRLDRVLHTFHRECADKRIVAVCHGEVMWGFRVRIERMSQFRFRGLHQSKDSANRLFNCQIIHYTRRDPETGKTAPYMNWMRMIRPTENPVWISPWEKIERPKYSNEDIATLLGEYPRVAA